MKFIRYFLVLFFLIITFASQLSAQWALVTYPDLGKIKCIAAKDTNLFIGGEGIYLSTDNGTSWNCLNIRCLPWDIFFYGTKIYMANFFNSLFVSSDNGINWINIGFPSSGGLVYFYCVATNGKSILFGSSGSQYGNYLILYISYDNGAHWNNSAFGSSVNDIAVIDSTYIIGTNSGPYLSLDNGASWNLVDEGLSNEVINTLAVSGSNLFAGTNDGVYFSTNKGVKWNSASNGLTNTHINALAVSGSNLYAGTNNGFFLSTNNGQNWISVNGGFTDTTIQKLAVSNSHVFAVTNNNTIWRRSISEITEIKKDKSVTPADFALRQNYPNPFNPTTSISFSISKSSFVKLKIFDALGREIATLVNEELPAGTYSRQWNASGFSSGVYFYRLQAGDYTATKKLSLLK
jgi:hypothetical protein